MTAVEDVQASRLRLLTAANQTRRLFERALHDGPQQHLVALAVSVRLARTMAKSDPSAVDDVLAQLGNDVQTTLEDLRELAHRIYPPLLEDRGLAHAVNAAGDRLAGTVEVGDLERLPPDVEAALYFACTDAMEQNADVRLWCEDSTVHLLVTGADVATTSLADTVAALGGDLRVDATTA
jgi:signal transduction histidine kinase